METQYAVRLPASTLLPSGVHWYVLHGFHEMSPSHSDLLGSLSCQLTALSKSYGKRSTEHFPQTYLQLWSMKITAV